MKYQELKDIVANGAAIRYRCRLQPAGGAGDKVFPPTYEGGSYATENRTIIGQSRPCVHLDSVQSQANRMELAILETIRSGKVTIPVIEVQFPDDDPLLRTIGTVTNFETPHRLADAILRDSEYNGTRFRESDIGKILDSASVQNATDVFGVGPSSLLFGMWDSTGPLGGLGAKFQRAIASEVVGIGVEYGVRTASRIDPLGIELKAGPVYLDKDTGELKVLEKKASTSEAAKDKKNRPSEVNHGNVTPSVSAVNGGVTFEYALQSTLISLPALRRLQFPIEKAADQSEVNTVAQTVLAAMGILGASQMIAKGLDLRTRTLLVPEDAGDWEAVLSNGQVEKLAIDPETITSVFNEAVSEATKLGLPWHSEPITLSPSKGLVELVRRSKTITAQNPES